jgi:hypothetical protein
MTYREQSKCGGGTLLHTFSPNRLEVISFFEQSILDHGLTHGCRKIGTFIRSRPRREQEPGVHGFAVRLQLAQAITFDIEMADFVGP